jgi:hypothetical protein
MVDERDMSIEIGGMMEWHWQGNTEELEAKPKYRSLNIIRVLVSKGLGWLEDLYTEFWWETF